MKEIIESIKVNREQLINEYKSKVEEIKTTEKEMGETLGRSASRYDTLRWKSSELKIEAKEIWTAINDLGNALNHLGESTETFWGTSED